MRHLRMVGVCLVAVFAMTAIAATSASALPEFGQCYVQAKHEGKYANAGCTVKAKKVSEKFTGGFEWRKQSEVAKKGFTGAGGAGILNGVYVICTPSESVRKQNCNAGEGEEHLATSVECTSEKAAGIVNGSNTVGSVAVKFFGCKALGSTPCSNSSEPETIEVNTLKGKLGYINKLKKEVGIELNPVIKNGPFVSFNCGGSSFLGIVVGVGNKTEGFAYLPNGGGDGIISPITPVNTMSPTYTQVYTTTAEDENIPNKFGGTAPLQVLESYLFNAEKPSFTSKWSKAGESVTNVNTGEEAGEIKA
jgi:hypothetical protein